MNKQPNTISPRRQRTGFSLIEVIICVGLVAVMLIPLAGMMRASAHAWQEAESEGGSDAELRTTARYVQNTIRHADQIVDSGSGWLEFDQKGVRWRLEVSGNQLWMHSKSNKVLIADHVEAIGFSPRKRPVDGIIHAVDFKMAATPTAGITVPTVYSIATLDSLKLP